MKLKLKKIDWKKLMLERGEKIGLYTCLGIMGLMVIFGLFWPGNGFFSGSAAENANNLKSQNEETERRIASATPSATELDGLKKIQESLLNSGEQEYADPDNFRSDRGLFLPPPGEDSRRRAPIVLEPAEYKAAVTLAQVRRYIFNREVTQVMMLRGLKEAPQYVKDNKTASKNFKTNQTLGFNSALSAEGNRGGGGFPGLGIGQRPATPDQGLPPSGAEKEPKIFEGNKTALKVEYVDLDKIDAVKDGRLAEDILPLRMVTIVGGVPLKKQLEQFQQKLRLPNLSQVIADREIGDEKDKTAPRVRVPQFQFVGLNIERREIGRNGKPGEWTDPKIENAYRQLVALNGRRWEKHNEELLPIILPGLVMPLPMQFRENQYTPIETQLKTIETTLAKLKEQYQAGQTATKPVNRFSSKDLDVFGAGEEPPEKPPEEKQPMTGKPGEVPEWSPPEHCLMRFVDITVEPGKTYEYRFRIRMANPNYKHENVAWKDLAKEKELTSEWFNVKDEKGEMLQVKVQPEAYFYASETRPGGIGKHQTAVQFHRWLQLVQPNPKSPNEFTVADWVVAETLVNRGEYLNRTEEASQPTIEVPIWLYTQESFVLATNPAAKQQDRQRIPVPFSPGSGDYLLVDFQGSLLRHTKLSELHNDKPKRETVTDRAPVEMLYLSPDGKLLARDSQTDKQNKEREERLKQYKQRLDEIKRAAKPEEPKEKKP